MSTTKPKIVIYTDEITINKLDEIATKHNRSRANMADTIIKKYIQECENNGNIQKQSIYLKNR